MRNVLIFLILLLSSCNFAPQYVRPDMELTEKFRFEPENSIEYANLPWWEQLGDPVLTELIRTALKNNYNLQVATATVANFYAQYQVAFAPLLPAINGNFLDERIFWDTPKPLTWLYQLAMSLSYEIDFWGKIRNAAASAEANYLAQIDTRLNLILSIVSGVATAYVTLLQLDNQLLISKQTLEARQELYRISKLRYDAGLTSLLDVRQAEAQVQDAEAQLSNFEALIPVQEDLISILLGAQPGPIPRGKLLQELKLPPAIPAGLTSDLLENRPDIMAAEQNLISAIYAIGSARAAFFPQFTITGLQGKQTTMFNDLLKHISNYSEWQFEATQPLFTGGFLRGQLGEAEANYLEQLYTYQQTVLTALQQVSDSLVTYEINQETLGFLVQETNSYIDYLRLAKLRYYNGLVEYLTVQIAEENLFTVQLTVETARASIFIALIDIYTALGQGWDLKCDYCDACDNPYPLWKALIPP